MKTTQKNVRSYLNDKYISAVDCTMWTDEEYKLHNDAEHGFDEICYSVGVYGRNGLVMQGRRTGTFYVVPSRSSALFCFNW